MQCSFTACYRFLLCESYIAYGHIRKISAYRAFAVLAILWAPLTGEQLLLDAMEVHL